MKELTKALVAFRAECPSIGKDSVNPHFKSNYASLSNILEVIVPVLTKHGLMVVQAPNEGNLDTTIMHVSGESIKASMPLNPSKNDPQGMGSAITYARRYALGGMLSLNIDDDDDGNMASQAPARRQEPQRPVQRQEPAISPKDYKSLFGTDKDAGKKMLSDYTAWARGLDLDPVEFAGEAWTAGCRSLSQIYTYQETGEVE